MVDHNGDTLSETAAVLAEWMTNKSTPQSIWRALDGMDDNVRVEVIKDPHAYRGKKLCSRGTITQIFADRSLGKPVRFGVLDTGIMNIIRFVAVGSSQGVMEGAEARFCGIIIRLHGYSNVMGGRASASKSWGASTCRRTIQTERACRGRDRNRNSQPGR
jgi:hypothetical protein